MRRQRENQSIRTSRSAPPPSSDSPFLNSSIPYVEASRVQASIFRRPNNNSKRSSSTSSGGRLVSTSDDSSNNLEQPKSSLKQQPIWQY
mmetsp:Transcript_16442/g.20031  ORF Transcript_16442/g.20031 Transcript_16442/m.20031 type:complete len:89 (-) Transcript_16442:7-273(-)